MLNRSGSTFPISFFIGLLISGLFIGFLLFYEQDQKEFHRKRPKLSQTGRAMTWWYESRVFPTDKLDNERYIKSFSDFRSNQKKSALVFTGNWEAIGPKNFGGRTLCLAFNPQNHETIFAGSASGGLWRTYSDGNGAEAWEEMPTGFPVLGVGAIAINPLDTNEMYIGTGEVYNYQNTGTGFAVRTTRGTYGVGILKSSDGGATWSQSLQWQYDELTGVQDLLINPLNPNTVFAATTEGIFRTLDAGANWNLVHNVLMGIDLEMMPGDTSIILASCGNSGSASNGVYKSTNGGNSWTSSSTGIPGGLTGKILFDIADASPNIVIASVADQLVGYGLYKSINFGATWTQINFTDFQLYQGWYSHDVAIDPTNPQNVICTGINVWKSTDGGTSLFEKSLWYQWDFNAVTPGGSEGPPDYVHADIHQAIYHPSAPGVIYFATDGGIFRSWDNGLTFEGANGGYQTQQFYANFSNSMSDSLFGLGGMQDNATAVYEGNDGWRRVIGGDGLSTAVNPINDQEVYASYQYLGVRKSTDKAQNFSGISVPGSSNNTCFAGPYELSRSNTSVLYAGRTKVYKSTNAGGSWTTTNSGNDLDGNPVLTIEISAIDPDKVYVATAPVNSPVPKVYLTSNGGNSWSDVTGNLPNRYIMDVVVNPSDDDTVFAVISGFGTDHLYRSVNSGGTWVAHGAGLPDVPTNSLFIDPMNTNVMYIGNDLGIYVSIDAGASWIPFNDGLIDATFVMHISHTSSNRKLRIATHGNGVYQRDMLPITITGIGEVAGMDEFDTYPNPASNELTFDLEVYFINSEASLIDMNGRVVKNFRINQERTTLDVSKFDSGNYLLKINNNDRSAYAKIMIQH